MDQKIKITFECHQDWEQMRASGNGRFCEFCSKSVHDFSNKSKIEISKIGKEELCGMFLTEQVDTDLRPIEFPGYLRTSLLTIGTVIGLELKQANGQPLNHPPKIENVVTDTAKTDTLNLSKQENKIDHSKTGSDECEKVKKSAKTKYYFSKRFPFIVKRRVRLMGRFRA
ncbi:MAG: hypothetical protein HOP30_15170 [Cyclobacteriaceae bacterium]|nr:hypothetical protein [Cyclobacteriaceae bacterium]